MKAISIKQPWAQLIVLGYKQYETRGWNTHFRGRVLIHSSQRFESADRKMSFSYPFDLAYKGGKELPLGAIIGSVEIVLSLPATEVAKKLDEEWNTKEILLGDYSKGRWAYKLENPILFDRPLRCRGNLGLWDCPDDVYRIIVDSKMLEIG